MCVSSFLADIIIPSSPLPLAACIFYICILPCVSCYCFGAISNFFLFVSIGSWFYSLILASVSKSKQQNWKRKNEAREREEEIRPGERERSGGAPEREGGAARGRSDGGSKVISRRPERTIWSGSATAVGDGSGTPWTEEGSTYSTRRTKNKFSGVFVKICDFFKGR
ncbi:hypothetical protein QL285_079580 [Trifolium repens]|nr:hypothetical protein QL285_079580 [Trifolium repens]